MLHNVHVVPLFAEPAYNLEKILCLRSPCLEQTLANYKRPATVNQPDELAVVFRNWDGVVIMQAKLRYTIRKLLIACSDHYRKLSFQLYF